MASDEPLSQTSAAPSCSPEEAAGRALSRLLIQLLRGVVYQTADALLWTQLLRLQPQLRDQVAVLGLELVLDETEGYAFLRSPVLDPADQESAGEPSAASLPRLVLRRPLSFPVSLLLALLRKKLAESDASGNSPRLVLGRDDVLELMRVFLPSSSNQARLADQLDTHLNKIVELGFLRKLKVASGQPPSFEVLRILKAFVDAQWLAEFDARLASYQAHALGMEAGLDEGGGEDDAG